MEDITIIREGKTVSRICFSDNLQGIVALLERSDAKYYLVYDAAVESHAKTLMQLYPAFASVHVLDKVNETNKTLDTVSGLCRWLMDCGADRKAVLVALGGGIVSDMAGFAASIYKRGIETVYIPTTLLAQVDAAIGGKTGVNLDAYKNMIGTFHQPEITFICSEVLKTLPEPLYREGLAELIKTFIISDNSNWSKLEKLCTEVSDFGELRDGMSVLIAEAAKVKAEIVSRDEFEGGERMKLNLGHTFAHAIEHCSQENIQISGGRAISHGEAVAIGMAMAARLSVSLSMLDAEEAEKIISMLRCCALPVDSPFSMEELAEAMAKDKKSEGDKINFALIRSIGNVVIQALSLKEVISFYDLYSNPK